MADKKISALTGATTPLAGTEVLPIVQGGATVKVSVANLTDGRDITASALGVGTAPATPIHVASAIAPTTSSILRIDNTATTAYASGGYVGGQVRLNYTNATDRYSGVNFSNTNATSQEFFGVVQEAGGSGAFVWQGFSGGYNERMRLDSGFNLTLPFGNLIIGTSGKGVQLPGGITWTSGSGSPEGVVTAPVGSLYSRSDGGLLTSLYVKQSGSGNTGWDGK
jgi:hypothetical protein